MTSTADETIARLKEKAEAEAGTEEEVEGEAEEYADDVEEEEVEEEVEDEPVKKSDAREYVVLQTWTEAARIVAPTSKSAVEALGATNLKSGHKYVAVPVRNWNEHEAVIEQVTTISVK
jgi:hypothetical protein